MHVRKDLTKESVNKVLAYTDSIWNVQLSSDMLMCGRIHLVLAFSDWCVCAALAILLMCF